MRAWRVRRRRSTRCGSGRGYDELQEALQAMQIDDERRAEVHEIADMQQHVLDDRVGALAVLHDLVEIAPQRSVRQKLRKVVDEIQRVLDLMRNPGGQLTEQGRASPSGPGGPAQSANPSARLQRL